MQMASGRIGEMNLKNDMRLALTPSEYFERNVWVGVSFPGVNEARAMKKLGLHKVMWGSDYPHNEGSGAVLARAPAPRVPRLGRRPSSRQVFSGTIADVYGFDRVALAPIAAECRPHGRGAHGAAREDPEGRVQPRLLAVAQNRVMPFRSR